MSLDDRAGDGQSEAGLAALSGVRRVGAVEAIEDVRYVLRGDAAAVSCTQRRTADSALSAESVTVAAAGV